MQFRVNPRPAHRVIHHTLTAALLITSRLQVHFKHVSKVGSTSYGDLLIDVAAAGWEPIVIKAECFDLREVHFVP